jgi:Rrf2 family nitric oxide-sensitive transcriptional repressor
MRITLHLDYALRSLIFLAAHRHKRVTTQQVSDAYGISKNHLVRVMQNLEKHGFVKLTHGRGGGLALAMEPSEINLGAVTRAMEPNMDLVECFNNATNTCPISPVCRLKGILHEAGNAFLGALGKYTLADVTGQSNDALRKHFLIQIEEAASSGSDK